MIRQVELPGRWVSAILFDHLLLQGGNPPLPCTDGVEFRIPPGCSLLLDAVIRMLAYANQMSAAGYQTTGAISDFTPYYQPPTFIGLLGAPCEYSFPG